VLASRVFFHQGLQRGSPIVLMFLLLLLTGCGFFWSRPVLPPDPAITVIVAPVTMEISIRTSEQIHSFYTAPTPETELIVKKELVEEVELKAQRFLTEH
jgi:hypothetical protein